jgi:hypothetical protein
MADESPAQTGTPILYPNQSGEYRFVTGVSVRAEKMVYVDFMQDNGGRPALGITRIVMHPDLAADLLEKLSGLHGPN